MIGSLVGALCAGLAVADHTLSLEPQLPSLVGLLLHAACFPLLLFAAFLLRSRKLMLLLFALKGAAVAFALCSLFRYGAYRMSLWLLEPAAALPFWILSGSLWLEQTDDPKGGLWPLLPALLVPAAIACLHLLFFRLYI